VVQCARAIFWLYGNVFRGLDRPAAGTAAGTLASQTLKETA